MEGFFATTIYSFSVLFCLCGCDTLPTYKLYNNTGHTIRILGYDKMGSSIRYEAVDKARCQIAIPDKLVIGFNRTEWEYGWFPPLPDNRCDMVRVGSWHYNFQIQDDGEIFSLLREADSVTEKLPDQPPGFPVKPR